MRHALRITGVAVALSALSGAVGIAATVTFTEHIAPIVFHNCTGCHRPGEAAPFTLMNYGDVVKRGKLIAAVT
jgi:hypothetical protein